MSRFTDKEKALTIESVQVMYFHNLLFYFYSEGMKVLLSLRQVIGIFLPNEVTMMVKVGPTD